MIIQGNDPFREASFSLGNRIARAAWMLVWAVFGRTSPVPFHAWRTTLLRLFGARVGRGARVYPKAEIWAPWLFEIGEESTIADHVRVYSMARIMIGRRCVVSQGAYLCTGSHDIDSPNFQLIASSIQLGDQVWVCAEAFVGPGVRIADGCVIAARAVLTRSAAQAGVVWKGNPAQATRTRKLAFPDVAVT